MAGEAAAALSPPLTAAVNRLLEEPARFGNVAADDDDDDAGCRLTGELGGRLLPRCWISFSMVTASSLCLAKQALQR